MRADLVELLTPISDHYATFAQGVEHLPSQAHPAELVVEALMHSFGCTPSEHVAFGSGLSRSAPRSHSARDCPDRCRGS